MAGKSQSRGKCRLCGKSFTKGAMTRHLGSCRRKSAEARSGKGGRRVPSFHIAVDSGPDFWLHLEAAANATLRDLDDRLRAIWLECCGHLSDFEIDGTRYTVSYGELDMAWTDEEEASMDVRLDRVLVKGTTFLHTYDYGTTTQCRLRVVAEGDGLVKSREIEILARNDPPDIRCDRCGKPATHVCTECVWSGEGWFCHACLAEHECGDEMALPVVNSPRVGMCAYTGGVDD